MGGNAARQEPNVLRLPAWVLSKIALRSRRYTGELRIAFYQGGVVNLTWRTIEKERP